MDPQGRSDPRYGRDPARTPMQWDAGANAGFCPEGVEPWLPVADDRGSANVRSQRADPRSMLVLFHPLATLRRTSPALSEGSYRPLDTGYGLALAYLREHGDQRLLVALHFGGEPRTLDLSEAGGEARLLLSTHLDRTEHPNLKELALRPGEGVLLSLTT
jgi:alpha-glucosidase